VTLEEAGMGTTRVLRVDGKRLEVNIPPGVKTGSRVRVPGKGGARYTGGPRGDLYLKIKVMPHPTLERVGDDLYCSLSVDLYTAILGGLASVPALKGLLSLKIPPQTQNGRTFRLKGQGMPSLSQKGAHGDLFVKVQVKLPQNLSEKEKSLFEELARLRSDKRS
jgi:curved DNA-binding protein